MKLMNEEERGLWCAIMTQLCRSVNPALDNPAVRADFADDIVKEYRKRTENARTDVTVHG